MKEYTEIAMIIDRSGSMHGLEKDTIGGYNTFLKEQQAHPGEANFTLVQFDDKYEKIHDSKSIGSVPLAGHNDFMPRGSTALFDAIGKTINDLGIKFDKLSDGEKPSKVIVAIITDGGENDSKEYKSKEKIAEMIKRQTDEWDWEFFFLAANQDAFAEASSLNIPVTNSANFTHDSAGVRDSYSVQSSNVSSSRTK